jgi:hypothetical protein
VRRLKANVLTKNREWIRINAKDMLEVRGHWRPFAVQKFSTSIPVESETFRSIRQPDFNVRKKIS